ncbi:MAG TPA: O-antigen ligase family protein [Solirubrobacteraceae bacterium]|nr:O-antigen ligase family protein [Solirubrobacteraceae bacterium]
MSADGALALAVGLALAAVALAADGGLRLERTTWTEVGLMCLGASLAAGALLTGRAQGRLHGALTLLALAALAVFTALSIVWSLAPAESWLEANRTIAYVAAFAGVLALVRMVPGRWAAVLHGVILGCLLVCGVALLTKVFPAALAPDETFARLREPFGYWNAVGLMAALGVPPLLWLAARRSGHLAANALAWPGLGLLFACLMLSYSRGALLALAFGLAFWFVAVPLRLRSALPLIAATLAAAPVVAWAFTRDALATDRVPLAARSDAGTDLGALLLLMAVVLLIAGLAANFAVARFGVPHRARRIAAGGLIGLMVAVPVILVVALAAAPGGVHGQVSNTWDKLTNPLARTPANTPDRLTTTSSVRARYWDEALKVYDDTKLVGAGAGAFVVARSRHRTDRLAVRHAHGYAVQTLADLGLLGLGLSLLATGAWVATAMRSTGLRRRDRGLGYDPERIGLLTMATVVLVFGVHSLIDWTWFVPGTAVVALLCAAWVAGRGPLRERLAAPREPATPPAPVRPWRERLAAYRPPRAAGAVAVAMLAVALAGSWAAIQPVRAARAEDRAIDDAQLGRYAAAAASARTAAARNPLSVEPLWQLAFIEDARNHERAAADSLEAAVRLQPANPEAWRRLGRYQLSALDDPKAAVAAFRATYFLDPQAPQSLSDFLEASRAARQRKGP